MAKVPEGSTAADWDGAGSVWFKVFGQGPDIAASGLTWPSQGSNFPSISRYNGGWVASCLTLRFRCDDRFI
jgi:hypothetical protein